MNKILRLQLLESSSLPRKMPSLKRTPPPNYVTLLPEEIWVQIFSYLGEKCDLINVCLSCPKLSSYLTRSKRTFLIEDVMPILCNFGHIHSYLTVLECRQICKSWKAAVDHVLESKENPFSEDDLRLVKKRNGRDISSKRWRCSTNFNSSDVDTRANFLETRYLSNENPFPGRSVCYQSVRGDKQNLFYRQIDGFLHSYGVHIAHLHIKDHIGAIEPMFCFRRMQNLLEQIPHLKSLRYEADYITGGLEIDHNYMYRSLYPPAPMAHLDKLGTFFLGIDPVGFLYSAMRGWQIIQDLFMTAYSAQLKALQINASLWKPEYCGANGLKNLVELEFKNITSNQHLGELAQKILQEGRYSMPELIRLEFEFNFYLELHINFRSLMQIIGYLRQVSPKLRVVALTVFTGGPRRMNLDSNDRKKLFLMDDDTEVETALGNMEREMKDWLHKFNHLNNYGRLALEASAN